MGFRTLVLAFMLLALVAYVSSAPFPSESSESKSHDESESLEISKSHSDESISASTEKLDDHDKHGGQHTGENHKHKRNVEQKPTTLAETTPSNDKTDKPTEHLATHDSEEHESTSSESTSAQASVSLPTTDRSTQHAHHNLEFYPLQTLFP